MDVLNKLIRYLILFCSFEQFILPHALKLCDRAVHFAHMADRLYNIAGSRLAFGSDHGSTFVDTAKRLAEISCTADERNLEVSFIDMVDIVGRRENLALIDIVDLDCLKHLSLHKMTDPAFCHDRNRNCLLDAADHFRVAHS